MPQLNDVSALRLPEASLVPSGFVSESLLALGMMSFQNAAAWIKDLPYGRNSNRADYLLVLSERKGTCSTKHALLAQLSNELGLSTVKLVMGIYNMTEHNTPGVGSVLRKYELGCLPEAHCYLKIGSERFDFTRTGCSALADADVELEITIAPNEIGTTKEKAHKAYIKNWLAAQKDLRFSECDIWSIREECIQAISNVNKVAW